MRFSFDQWICVIAALVIRSVAMSFNLQFCQALLKGEMRAKEEDDDILLAETQELPGQLSNTYTICKYNKF